MESIFSSISPSSILKPRNLIWWSTLPKHWTFPSNVHLPISPDLYILPLPNLFGRNLSFVISGFPKYPKPTWIPEIYISPTTPIGTGCIYLSNICIWVFIIGGPIVILSSWFKFCTLDRIVISLGPYMLYIVTFFERSLKSCTNFSGKGSPPNTIYFIFDKADGSSLLS